MFKNHMHTFSSSLTALRDFVNLISPFLVKHQQKVAKPSIENTAPLVYAIKKFGYVDEFKDISEEKILKKFKGNINVDIKKEKDKQVATISVTGEGANKFNSFMSNFGKVEKQKILLYESSLISLISFVESFLSNILHDYFSRFPNIIDSGIKSLSLNDLKTFKNIEDAEKYLIENNVRDIMYGNITDWIQYLKNQIKISLGYLKPEIDNLIEIYQRRNILIHNGGKISSDYLAKVKPELRGNLKHGDKISIDPNYLDSAINKFELIFILIAAEIWKKLDFDNDERADTLIDIAYDHLLLSNYTIAEGISHFMMNDKKTKEIFQLIGKMNYWQSLKWQDKLNNVLDDVKTVDLSAKPLRFQLAQYALLDDTRKFFKLLPTVLENKELSFDELNSWPIFKLMRKKRAFKSYVKENNININ